MSLPRRTGLQPREVLARLEPSLRSTEIVELGEGWDNVAWLVDDRLVLRLSKHADAAERKAVADKDIRLLQLVGRDCPLQTSQLITADTDDGALLLTHVPGTGAHACPPTDTVRVVEQLTELVRWLWHLPVADAAHVVGPDRDQAVWLAETVRAWEGAAHLFEPADRRDVERFLAEPIPAAGARTVFSHNDLGEEHLLVDPSSGALSGVIDWSDACLGDPARDLALILVDLDPVVFDGVFARHPESGEDLMRRVRWYAARAAVEGVAHRAVHAPQTTDRLLSRLRRVVAG